MVSRLDTWFPLSLAPSTSVRLSLLVKKCKSIGFRKEVYDCLTKVVILERRRIIFQKGTGSSKEESNFLPKVMILVRRCFNF